MTEKDIPVSKQDFPGTGQEMPNPKPVIDKIPQAGGGQREYIGTGKLQDKKAVITGGDSGIGAASAVLFAKEGADVTIAYLPEEEKDAQETKELIEKEGRKAYLISLDLSKRENCKKLIDFSLEKMGGIDILFNNAACKFIHY